MTWQLYWRHWHFGYKKVLDEDYLIHDNYLFIGPLQIKWYTSAIPTNMD